MDRPLDESPERPVYTNSWAQIISALGDVLNSKNSMLIFLVILLVGAGAIFKYGVDLLSEQLYRMNTTMSDISKELVKQNTLLIKSDQEK